MWDDCTMGELIWVSWRHSMMSSVTSAPIRISSSTVSGAFFSMYLTEFIIFRILDEALLISACLWTNDPYQFLFDTSENGLLLLPICQPDCSFWICIYFSCLFTLDKTSKNTLENTDVSRHPILVPDIRKKCFQLFSFNMILVMCLFNISCPPFVEACFSYIQSEFLLWKALHFIKCFVYICWDKQGF